MQPSCNSVHCSGLFLNARQSLPQRKRFARHMAAAATTGMADKERWSRAWAQEKSDSVRSSSTSSTPQPRQMSKEETAQPAAVTSPVDLNDLESRSSDSRSTRRRIMAREASAGFVKIRRPAETPPAHEWTNLNAPTTAAGRTSSWDSLVRIEAQRQKLLALARSAAPIDTVFRLSLLPRTVIPRLRMYKSFWFVLGVYGVSATLTRLGYEIEASLAREILDSGSSFVAFMIVFFVGDSAPAPQHDSRWPSSSQTSTCGPMHPQAIATSATKNSSTMCSTS